jgi:hypothetical protein
MSKDNTKRVYICWHCGDYHDPSRVTYDFNASNKTVLCHCGGMVVTPSGKEKTKLLTIVPVWLLEDGSEIFRVAAHTEEEAIDFLVKDQGMEDTSDVVSIEIFDSRELNRKFIESDNSHGTLFSILDVIQQAKSIPTLISSSID